MGDLAERWERFTLAQQLGNIGSELARARHWEEKGDVTPCEQSLARAIELIDLTLDDPKHRFHRKEIARLREVVCDWYSRQHYFEISPIALEKYCTAFVLGIRG